MSKLVLEIPMLKHQKPANEYVKKMALECENIPGGSQINNFLDDYENWLKKIEADLINYTDVPRTTYFVVRKKDAKIVGMLNIRHQLNEQLMNRGSIGYSVLPEERKKGYGSIILKSALMKCKEIGLKRVLVVCEKNNEASIKTISKNGGKFENEVESEFGVIRRYWIKII